jgi:aconitase B
VVLLSAFSGIFPQGATIMENQVKPTPVSTHTPAEKTAFSILHTTGPMTRDEIKELACLKFSAPLVMQSFCHTAAYPKPVDVKTHQTLPGFIGERVTPKADEVYRSLNFDRIEGYAERGW